MNTFYIIILICAIIIALSCIFIVYKIETKDRVIPLCPECDTYMVYQGVKSKDYKLYKMYVCPNCGKIEYLMI